MLKCLITRNNCLILKNRCSSSSSNANLFKPTIYQSQQSQSRIKFMSNFSTSSSSSPVRLSLNSLPRLKEQKKKRMGRGGQGKTAGRGRKGWKAKHSQNGPTKSFEGGQSTIAKKIPKLGVQQKSVLKDIQRNLRQIHMDKLQMWIDMGKLDATKKITIREICLSGVAGKVKEGVVLLARGAEFFTSKVDIEVTKASQAAINAIEGKGGKVTTVYTDRELIRATLSPEKYAILPEKDKLQIPPTRRLIAMYSDEDRRGYLAPIVKEVPRDQLLATILKKAGVNEGVSRRKKRAATAVAMSQ